MWRIAIRIALTIVVLLALTGCISRRADVNIVVDAPKLDDTNSRYVSAPGGEFSVRLTPELDLMKDVDEGGAQLYSVIRKGGDNRAKHMFIESTSNSIDTAISLLDSVEGVRVVRRESVVKAGYEATKLITTIEAQLNKEVQYYLLSTNGRTYVFSLPQGAPWLYFESVIDSFQRN